MTAPARPLPSPPRVSAQFGRFLTVGLTNTALSLLAYAVLVQVVPYWLAGALAFAAGAVNGFVLNRRWTFAAPDSGGARLRYLTVQLAGLGATTGLLRLYVSGAGVGRMSAYALTIPAVTVATFAANRGWTFGNPDRDVSERDRAQRPT
jgi:putative flippase GtrA